MSFQDPPRRQRLSRYPAQPQYEDGYSSSQDNQVHYSSGDGYQGFAGLAGAPQQRTSWDDPRQQSMRDTGAQRTMRNTGAQRPLRDSGSQQSVGDTGSPRSIRDSGSQRSIWDTGSQPAVRDFDTQRPPWEPPVEQTSWDTSAQQAGWERPRRAAEVFQEFSNNEPVRPRHAAGGEQRRGGGLLPGAVAGFLAAAVALGVANLVAAFVRPQASPIIAVGEAFIDRTPPALKNFAVQKFGENDKNMLLLGMYVTIALIAIAIGMLAWRRVAIGVAGIGLFGLFGAFVAITRPESHVTDVIPSIVGGIVGIVVIVWLVRIGTAKPVGAAWTGRARGTRRGAVWTGGNS